MKIIPHSIVGNTTLFEEIQSIKRNSSNKNSPQRIAPSALFNPMNQTSTSKKEIKKNYFDYVDDSRVKSIFKDYLEIKDKNKEKLNDFMKKIPIELRHELKKQELNLKLKNFEDSHLEKLSEFLGKRLNKKPEQLLINRIDEHRLKKEFSEFMENKILSDEKENKNNWILSLRRNKNNQFLKNYYLNVGNKYNPIWISVRDKVNKSVDIIRNPTSKSSFDLKNFRNNKVIMDNFQTSNVDSSLNFITNALNNNSNLSFNILNNSAELDTSIVNSNNLNLYNNINTNANSYKHASQTTLTNMQNSTLNDIQVKIFD